MEGERGGEDDGQTFKIFSGKNKVGQNLLASHHLQHINNKIPTALITMSERERETERDRQRQRETETERDRQGNNYRGISTQLIFY